MAKKILIVGGVAGGATAATRLRRLNEQDEIILFEKGDYISFANCGLPYHVGNVIKERDDLLLQTVEGMQSQYGLDIRISSEVLSIDPKEKTVTVLNHQTQQTYQESYDKLILSPGAKAIKPPIDGLDQAGNVFTLRNIPDMDQIKAYIANHQVKVATVIGGGFIGLEMVENLHELGLDVQLVEMSPQVMPTLDTEMAQQLHSQLNLHGVSLYLNDGVTAFKQAGKEITLASGTSLQSDLTILSIGVLPETTLAKTCDLELGVKGAIKVDDQFETSQKDIYAIGDVIEVKDAVDQSPTHIPLAWPANRQGRLVADVINGLAIDYRGTQGTSAAKVFELTAASTGNSERILKNKKIVYQAIHIHPNSHAGYYPGASPMHMKLLVAKDGTILGAQAVGTDGVDKRIDVIATAMRFGAKAHELASVEVAYAPPYSSAKDPVNMFGYIVDNLMNETVETFQWHEVDDLKAQGAYFLDVREEFELATGKIDGSVMIPLNQLRDRLAEIPKDQTIYVLCQVGLRGYNAARVLKQAGYRVKNLDGGYKTYKLASYTIKNKPLQSKSRPIVTTPIVDTTPDKAVPTIEVDACGLQCPGPILKVKEQMDNMTPGQKMIVSASDFGFSADIESWAKTTGNTVLTNEIQGKKVVASLVKGQQLPQGVEAKEAVLQETPNGATMVVFSGDMDKALASMIIATGAAAMGKPVTIFFTFWGLSILKKQTVKKRGMAKMFDLMLPNGAEKLPISKMNMGGLGSKMIQSVMKQKNVDPLPEMLDKAQKLGVKFIACTMSMDIMGIERDELFDFVEYGGVATYLGDSEEANLNLFI